MIKFQTARIPISSTGAGEPEIVKDLPLVNPSRFTRSGKATKVSGPIMVDDNGNISYSTFWQPIGMEGFTVRIQATFNTYRDPVGVGDWGDVNSGDLLYVADINCNEQGWGEETGGYDFMQLGKFWYVDSILIRGIKGTPGVTNMELTLMRYWPGV